MNRSGRSLLLGCLLLASPAIALAGGNSLLIPAAGRCALNVAPEDLPETLAQCQQMAIKGDSQAQYELGEYYYDGQRTPRDLKQALNWFEQASLGGHAQAQLRLGNMFFRGEGVPANNIQAFVVLKMSAVNGSEEALDTADLVAAQMRKDELDIATQVLGQIFRNYLTDLQMVDSGSPFAPLP